MGLAVSGAGYLESRQHPRSLELEGLLALERVQRSLHCTSDDLRYVMGKYGNIWEHKGT